MRKSIVPGLADALEADNERQRRIHHPRQQRHPQWMEMMRLAGDLRMKKSRKKAVSKRLHTESNDGFRDIENRHQSLTQGSLKFPVFSTSRSLLLA
jgi:hypothetical protein